MREVLKNNSSNTLSAGMTNSDTTLSVTDGSVFPSTGDFRLLIDAEILLCTSRSGNTLTVTRAQEGTSAVSHGGGSVVTHILTAGAVQRYGRDNDPAFDGGRPPFRICDASGNYLTSSDFTSVNLSTATIIDDQSGSITIRKATQGSSEDVTLLARSAPATPNALICALSTCWPTSAPSSSIPSGGVGFRESSSGKLFFIAVNNDSGNINRESLSVYKYNSPTSIASVPVDRHGCVIRDRYIWLKATDNGTNLIFSVSHDGVNWIQIYSEARTTFMSGGPDQFVFGANNYSNSFETLTTLESWSEG